MKICITAKGETFDAEVDPRFGRCKYFLIINTQTNTIKPLSNESLIAAAGAGIQAAQKIAKTGATTVITGNIGPNAYETLSAADIKVITGITGKVKEVLAQFNQGKLISINAPSVQSHYGMKALGGK
jgi:predicted Fe-Mo cluster-binding NifX family protein